MGEEETKEPAAQPTPEVKDLSSDKIKEMLEVPKEPAAEPEPKAEPKAEPKTEPEPPKEPAKPKEDEWFDKERGFKTKEDMTRSYVQLQNTLREKSEDMKSIREELKDIRVKADQRPLTQPEIDRQEKLKSWEEENKEAIEFLEKRVEERLERKNASKTFEEQAVESRRKWKEEFDKDESRRGLWPTMEKIYAEKGGNELFKDFAMNPLKYVEAMAFQQDFPSVADKIRAEGVEQYKAQIKEAEEAEKQSKTETPGGTRSQTGDIDVSKLSSDEIAKLLPKEE